MPLQDTKLDPVPPGRRRRLAGLTLCGLLLGSVVAGCGDDGRSTAATHRVVIELCEGRVDQRATGTAIAPDVVATVAHSLEGVRRIELRGPDGRSQSAEVVYVDPAKDIALLAPERPIAEHLTLAEPEGPGPVGVVRYDDRDERPTIDRAEITELVTITLDGAGRRAAVRLVADIAPGDSGAAVVDDDGRMVAMVFATARGTDVGWAISAVEVREAVAALERSGPGATPPAC